MGHSQLTNHRYPQLANLLLRFISLVLVREIHGMEHSVSATSCDDVQCENNNACHTYAQNNNLTNYAHCLCRGQWAGLRCERAFHLVPSSIQSQRVSLQVQSMDKLAFEDLHIAELTVAVWNLNKSDECLILQKRRIASGVLSLYNLERKQDYVFCVSNGLINKCLFFGEITEQNTGGLNCVKLTTPTVDNEPFDIGIVIVPCAILIFILVVCAFLHAQRHSLLMKLFLNSCCCRKCYCCRQKIKRRRRQPMRKQREVSGEVLMPPDLPVDFASSDMTPRDSFSSSWRYSGISDTTSNCPGNVFITETDAFMPVSCQNDLDSFLRQDQNNTVSSMYMPSNRNSARLSFLQDSSKPQFLQHVSHYRDMSCPDQFLQPIPQFSSSFENLNPTPTRNVHLSSDSQTCYNGHSGYRQPLQQLSSEDHTQRAKHYSLPCPSFDHHIPETRDDHVAFQNPEEMKPLSFQVHLDSTAASSHAFSPVLQNSIHNNENTFRPISTGASRDNWYFSGSYMDSKFGNNSKAVDGLPSSPAGSTNTLPAKWVNDRGLHNTEEPPLARFLRPKSYCYDRDPSSHEIGFHPRDNSRNAVLYDGQASNTLPRTKTKIDAMHSPPRPTHLNLQTEALDLPSVLPGPPDVSIPSPDHKPTRKPVKSLIAQFEHNLAFLRPSKSRQDKNGEEAEFRDLQSPLAEDRNKLAKRPSHHLYFKPEDLSTPVIAGPGNHSPSGLIFQGHPSDHILMPFSATDEVDDERYSDDTSASTYRTDVISSFEDDMTNLVTPFCTEDSTSDDADDFESEDEGEDRRCLTASTDTLRDETHGQE